MRYVATVLVAFVLFAVAPAAAERVTTIDTIALRENVLSVDHEWVRDLTSVGIKLAAGRQTADSGELTLLGGGIGKRWYVAAPGNENHRAYAGGYLFGQHISLDDGQDVGSQSAIGLISELGVKVKTRWGATIDVGPVVTIPVYAQAVYPDGDVETTDFRYTPITNTWKIGVGFSW
ncbi:MAG: hypothetical protein ACOYEP_10685 [Limnochordia bacterium]|mgnify:CR=1 FL=1|jgi:hypothetical protein